MKLQVTIRSVYGTNYVYPVNETAQLFQTLVGGKTLSLEALETIKSLGFEVEIVMDPKLSILLNQKQEKQQ